jgi:hypothetical protein
MIGRSRGGFPPGHLALIASWIRMAWRREKMGRMLHHKDLRFGDLDGESD